MFFPREMIKNDVVGFHIELLAWRVTINNHQLD